MSIVPLSALQQFEQAKQNLEKVKVRRTRVQVQLESARQQYQSAAQEAKDFFGTDNVSELKKLLAQRDAENLSAMSNCVLAIGDFDNFITRIEKALEDPQAMAAMVAELESSEKTVEPAVTPKQTANVVFAEDDI